MAAILRSHNAFCGSQFFYLGRKKFYKPGAVGVHHYERPTHFRTPSTARRRIPRHYAWVGIDNRPGAIPLHHFDWPTSPLLVFGNEHSGLDSVPEVVDHCQYFVEIPQLGSVRSLNVAVAAGICMYDLCLQKGWLHDAEKG